MFGDSPDHNDGLEIRVLVGEAPVAARVYKDRDSYLIRHDDLRRESFVIGTILASVMESVGELVDEDKPDRASPAIQHAMGKLATGMLVAHGLEVAGDMNQQWRMLDSWAVSIWEPGPGFMQTVPVRTLSKASPRLWLRW